MILWCLLPGWHTAEHQGLLEWHSVMLASSSWTHMTDQITLLCDLLKTNYDLITVMHRPETYLEPPGAMLMLIFPTKSCVKYSASLPALLLLT